MPPSDKITGLYDQMGIAGEAFIDLAEPFLTGSEQIPLDSLYRTESMCELTAAINEQYPDAKIIVANFPTAVESAYALHASLNKGKSCLFLSNFSLTHGDRLTYGITVSGHHESLPVLCLIVPKSQ